MHFLFTVCGGHNVFLDILEIRNSSTKTQHLCEGSTVDDRTEILIQSRNLILFSQYLKLPCGDSMKALWWTSEQRKMNRHE